MDDLLAFLADAGRPARAVARRRAELRTCQACSQWVVCGLDGDVLALSVQCDPAALSAAGKVAAGLVGTPTYLLDARGRLAPYSGRDDPVLPAHACGRALPPSGVVLRRLGAPRQLVNPENPPF